MDVHIFCTLNSFGRLSRQFTVFKPNTLLRIMHRSYLFSGAMNNKICADKREEAAPNGDVTND